LKGKRHATFLMWELFRLDPHAVKLMAAGRQQIAAILHRAEKDGKLPLALYKLDQGFKRLEKEFGVTASDTAAGSPQKRSSPIGVRQVCGKTL
jgi:hypothetical protein